MKGMTLGQYYPADAVLHRMDPRIKILCTIAFIVASFLCVNFFAFILLVASAVALIFLSRIPLKVVLRSVRPLIFIMAFTAFTGSVSHFAIGGVPDLFCLICCVLSTLLWARIAAKFANKAEPATLNRATGVVLVVLGAAILAVNYL